MGMIGSNLHRAKSIIEAGGLVAVPTETVYGLAADALNIEAVTSVFSAKNRPTFDPLIVHVDTLEAAEKYIEKWPPKALALAEKFWPGPLTLLLPKKEVISDLVTSGMEKVAIRVPDSELTLKLLGLLKRPLVAPSANPFGYVSPTCPQHVDDQLGDKISYILDGGPCEIGLESTIVGFDASDNAVIYRLGGLNIESIQAEIGAVKTKSHSSSNPQAPGMLTSHYSPHVAVKLGNIRKSLDTLHGIKRVGVISFTEPIRELPTDQQVVLAPDGSLKTAAKNLFSALRYMDTININTLLIEEVPDHGLGKAINDRLRRAAAKH
ncbi:MAG: L-threonylcarbamoyladenylate synthase [Bacteroidota bacterium]